MAKSVEQLHQITEQITLFMHENGLNIQEVTYIISEIQLKLLKIIAKEEAETVLGEFGTAAAG